MTKCKNCLEDLIKYVWNRFFKDGVDSKIHHRIVKCRNTIKVWILSMFFLLLCRGLQTTEQWEPYFNFWNYSQIRCISLETVSCGPKGLEVHCHNTFGCDATAWRCCATARQQTWRKLTLKRRRKIVFTTTQLQRLDILSKVTKTKARSCSIIPLNQLLITSWISED